MDSRRRRTRSGTKRAHYPFPFMGGVFEKAEEGIETDLAALTSLLDSQTVFVSHSPALSILDRGFAETRIGSESLRRFLEKNSFLAHQTVATSTFVASAVTAAPRVRANTRTMWPMTGGTRIA